MGQSALRALVSLARRQFGVWNNVQTRRMGGLLRAKVVRSSFRARTTFIIPRPSPIDVPCSCFVGVARRHEPLLEVKS
jgi:hypothetical protein